MSRDGAYSSRNSASDESYDSTSPTYEPHHASLLELRLFCPWRYLDDSRGVQAPLWREAYVATATTPRPRARCDRSIHRDRSRLVRGRSLPREGSHVSRWTAPSRCSTAARRASRRFPRRRGPTDTHLDASAQRSLKLQPVDCEHIQVLAYSDRIATVGSTLPARHAGTIDATTAVANITTAINPKTTGFRADVP